MLCDLKYYECDGGSLCVGTSDARVRIPNRVGDGTYVVIVTDSQTPKDTKENWEFATAIEGKNIKVFDYDCLTDEQCESEEHVLFTLSGAYGVYTERDSGDMLIEKWR